MQLRSRAAPAMCLGSRWRNTQLLIFPLTLLDPVETVAPYKQLRAGTDPGTRTDRAPGGSFQPKAFLAA